MRIISKFDGWCVRCHSQFHAGDPIIWSPGQKPQHSDLNVCDALKQSQPVKAPVARIAVEDSGVYVLPDGSIVKVQANKAKTKTYALRWHESPQRALEVGGRVRGDYEYEQGLVQKVAAEGRKMTLEEAKAFIVKYGQCARCSRHLKAAESVERGIGPVCYQYFTSGTTGASVLTGAVA